MTDDSILSRRLAFGRIGAIALAAFAVPTLLTTSKAFADDSEVSDSDGGSDDNESENETDDESDDEDDDDAGAVIAPSASAVSADGKPILKKKKKKK